MQLIHHPRAHLHQAMSMPQQLPQVPILCVRHPYSRKTIFHHQPQEQLRILTIRLLLAHPFALNLGGISNPQLHAELLQQTLEPARVPTGLHSHSHRYVSLLYLAVEPFLFVGVIQASFPNLPRFGIHVRNLLEARMIVTTYNQHVRLLSSEPFGWLAPPKSTRAWEPTLFMESFHSKSFQRRHCGMIVPHVSMRHSGCILH